MLISDFLLLYHKVFNIITIKQFNFYYILLLTNMPKYQYKNSSGDEIANVNFLTTISHTRRLTSKYRKRSKPTSFNKLDDR